MTGEIPSPNPEAAANSRRQFLQMAIGALTPETYRGDAHYREIPTRNSGTFILSDYMIFELNAAGSGGATTPELRRRLLEEGRPCLDIYQKEEEKGPESESVHFIIAHPEDIRPIGMLRDLYGTILAEAADDSGPAIIRSQIVHGFARSVHSLVDDPFQEPTLREIFESLTTEPRI